LNGPPDPPKSRRLSRKQTGFRLACSMTQLHRFEEEGRLTALRDKPDGVHQRVFYDADEVEKLAKTWQRARRPGKKGTEELLATNVRGPIAAKMFRAFHDNKDLRQVVIDLDVDPLLVRQMWDEWCALGRGLEDPAVRRRREQGEAEERELAREARKEKRMADWRAHQIERLRLSIRLQELGGQDDGEVGGARGGRAAGERRVAPAYGGRSALGRWRQDGLDGDARAGGGAGADGDALRAALGKLGAEAGEPAAVADVQPLRPDPAAR
jgi:hypothetical protein